MLSNAAIRKDPEKWTKSGKKVDPLFSTFFHFPVLYGAGSIRLWSWGCRAGAVIDPFRMESNPEGPVHNAGPD
jgi:hypothetical protein